MAAVYAGRLAHGQDVLGRSRARRLLPPRGRPRHRAESRAGNCCCAAWRCGWPTGTRPPLPCSARRCVGTGPEPQELDWLCVAYNLVAMDLWDDQAWFELATGQVGLARANGTLSWLPFALDYLAEIQIQAGELSAAAALLAEASASTRGSGRPPCPTSRCCWPRGGGTAAAA